MIAPPAEIIEGAVDSFIPNTDEVNELTSAIGQSTATKLTIDFPLSSDFIIGYQLGLHVARQILLSSVTLDMKNIDPKILL